MPDTTYTVDKDGAIIIKGEHGNLRYVKESDLLAVKGASESVKAEVEKTVAQHQAAVTEAQKQRDEAHAKLLQEQARIEKMEQSVKEVDAYKVKAGEFEAKLTAAETGRKGLEDELLGMKRTSFISTYKVEKDKVEKMTLAELRDAEKHLGMLGFNPQRPANFDGGGGAPGNGSTPKTPLEKAKEELLISRELAEKRRKGG